MKTIFTIDNSQRLGSGEGESERIVLRTGNYIELLGHNYIINVINVKCSVINMFRGEREKLFY